MWPVLDIGSEHLRRRKDLATIPLDIETAPRVYVEVHPGTRPTETEITVSKQILPGDGIAYRGQRQAEELLLEVADDVLDWLYDRRAHMPLEMLDGREARHRRVLREAIRKVRAGE
jgi:hypothetical protein